MENERARALPWLCPVSLGMHPEPGPCMALLTDFSCMSTSCPCSDLPCDLAFLAISTLITLT